MSTAINYFRRIIHWLIAFIVITDLFIVEEGELYHRTLGYAGVLLVVTRLIYGLTTKSSGHFRFFSLHPKELFKFFISTKYKMPTNKNHNPAASYVYFSLWCVIIGLGVTGYMMGLDRFWGEEWLEEIHELLADGLKILIAVHFFGMLIESFKQRKQIWLKMIKND